MGLLYFGLVVFKPAPYLHTIMLEHLLLLSRILQPGRKVLTSEMQLRVYVTLPLGAIGNVAYNALEGKGTAGASFAAVFAKFNFRKGSKQYSWHLNACVSITHDFRRGSLKKFPLLFGNAWWRIRETERTLLPDRGV